MIDLLKGILSSNRSQTENSSTFTSSVAWLNASVAICNLVLEISSSRSGRRTSPIFSNKSASLANQPGVSNEGAIAVAPVNSISP